MATSNHTALHGATGVPKTSQSHLPSPGPDMSDSEDRPQNHFVDSTENIDLSATTAQSEEAVAPFLAHHIPKIYNPIGHTAVGAEESNASTKFCYRHHPDLKCRRQANEPDMDQLQNDLGQLSQSDQQAISHVWSLFSAAPAKHRNLMLQGLLTQCCFPQLSFLSAAVRDLVKIDFLTALPSELGFKILRYLDTKSLCNAAQVSRRWNSLSEDDVVWHRMCEQHIDRKCTQCGWGLPMLERKRLRSEKRQMQLRANGRHIDRISPAPFANAAGTKRKADPETDNGSDTKKARSIEPPATEEQASVQARLRPWKQVYRDRWRVGTNWKHGRATLRTFKGHTNGVMCLQFDDTILATGSYDATIKIWDIETGEVLRTLSGHTSGVRCLQFDDTKLMSGSLDKTVKVWNWRTGECLRTFNAHTEGVIALHFDNNFLVSGSMDHTIRVYDLRSSAKCTFLLRGHTDWINSVKIDSASRTLLSASDDCTVRLWDLDTKRCLKVFEGHVGQVQQVMFLPHEFEVDEADLQDGRGDDDASSSGSQSPVLHRPSLHRHTHTSHSYHDHRHTPAPSQESKTQSFWKHDQDRPAPPRYMFTGALDSTIRLWDVHAPTIPQCARSCEPPKTVSCLRTFFGHVEGIWSLAADHLRLVSGSEDRMVKIWDPRSGKCERTWTGHAGPVTCVGLSDSRLVSGSEDCEVRMLVFGDENPATTHSYDV